MCYYLNVHFQGQRVKVDALSFFRKPDSSSAAAEVSNLTTPMIFVIFGVAGAETMNFTIFRDVITCSLVEFYLCLKMYVVSFFVVKI